MGQMLLKLVSGTPGTQGTSFQFFEQGGTIGRSESCDWTLSDVDRFISNKHALISFSNNQFQLTDISTNGVYVNNTSNLLGRDNQVALKEGDVIIIGEFKLEVASISLGETRSHEAESSGGLLDLVMGNDSAAKPESKDPLALLDKDNQSALDDSLGLGDIISSPVANTYSDKPYSEKQNFSPPNINFEDDLAPFSASSAVSSIPETGSQASATTNSDLSQQGIPEDWELSGIMPAVSEHINPPKTQEIIGDDLNFEPPAPIPEPDSLQVKLPDNNLPAEPIVEIEQQPSFEIEVPPKVEVPPKQPEVVSPPTLNPEPPIDEREAIVEQKVVENPSVEVVSSASSQGNTQSSDSNLGNASNDLFLGMLYEKLGLPVQYKEGINQEEFADDIATVLLSSTQGLMALLNGRSIFKQESRLSLTSIQPRSNNPLKFSIDPTDSLEMLLLKKKAGYLSAESAYEEAISDVQAHQMAFLAGLQASLVGMLEQLSPQNIEKEASDKGRGFLGLNAKAQKLKAFEDKQKQLVESAKHNLNEILSKHFADAYQTQIDNIKKD